MFAVIWLLIHMLINVAFAIGVAYDIKNLPYGRRSVLVGKLIWFLATLFGGPFVAALYWIIHRSTLCPSVFNNSRQKDPS